MKVIEKVSGLLSDSCTVIQKLYYATGTCMSMQSAWYSTTYLTDAIKMHACMQRKKNRYLLLQIANLPQRSLCLLNNMEMFLPP